MKIKLAALLFLLSCPVSVIGQAQKKAPASKPSDSWIRVDAEKGVASAQWYLGYIYASGIGVPQDYVEAARWYRKAAEQGDAGAQFSLGNIYYRGQGVPQDYAEAARWVRKAADQGNASGQLSLGHIYRYGEGVPQDYVEAHKWLNLAASRATGKEKEIADFREAVAKLMTPQQIAEAQRRAREWKPKGVGIMR